MNVTYIPAGADFLKRLAAHLREDSAQTGTHLSQYHILLPTRRAVRTLQGLLTPTDGSATFLPRIDAIGDLDDDALTLHLPDLDMPPVIAPTARLGLLIGLIRKRDDMPWPRAIALAEALAKLLDESILREVPLTSLEKLVPEDIAQHWQVSLEFLRVLTERWPEILKSRGEIDAATARQKLLHHYAKLWAKQKPAHPIIAAGSTGSLPATRALLKTIAELPRGMVVLPALDHAMPDDIWDELPLSHSQSNLKHMLDEFGLTRRDVKSLCDHECDHGVLWQQVLFPAEATAHWREDNNRLIKAGETNSRYLKNLHSYTAPDAENEARAIALIMQRAAAEQKTAALITPDRNLAQRTESWLARADIHVNDTAGQSLDRSLPGRWMRMLLKSWRNACDAVSVLALLKHPLSCFGTTRPACRAAAREIEMEFFRSEIPVRHLSVILSQKELSLPLREQLDVLCIKPDARSLGEWMTLLAQTGEQLTREGDNILLWQGEAGEALRKFCAELAQHSDHFPQLDIEALHELIEKEMQAVALRPLDAHPDLHILGPLEARLHHYDVVILGGLNEGTWPQAAPADPWLSRTMRADMQLAVPDEMIALAAHDFYQLTTQNKVYLTRAGFADGAPSLPSRWWQRLIAYLQACQLDKDILETRSLRDAVHAMHAAENIVPAPQPRPMPPRALRPEKFSPSGIETLMRNPYEFYAKYILQLRVLPDIGAEAAEKEQGNLLHLAFKQFTADYPGSMPPDAVNILDNTARALLDARHLPDVLVAFWWQNWIKARDNFIRWQQSALAAGRKVVACEHPLLHAFSSVTLHAIADRIDVDAAGNFVIVDYKRKKSNLTAGAVVKLTRPQLPIEAWLLEKCGIEGHPPRKVIRAEYWPLLEDDIIAPDEEAFADVMARLPDELGAFIDHYLDAENAFTAAVPNNPLEDQKEYIRLARAGEWQGGAA